MAEFKPAYLIVRKHEGNYVNHKDDAGQETYAGVARKFWPMWTGWVKLDELKAQGMRPVANMYIKAMESFVEDFYLKLWNAQKYALISNQAVANIVFDWVVNSGPIGIKKVQQILRDKMKEDIEPDGQLGVKTATLLNKYPAQDIFELVKDARIKFYDSIVARKPNQKVFYKGWMNRINSFELHS